MKTDNGRQMLRGCTFGTLLSIHMKSFGSSSVAPEVSRMLVVVNGERKGVNSRSACDANAKSA